MTKRGERRKAYEQSVNEAIKRVRALDSRFLDFSDQFPGVDGSLSDRVVRIERMTDAQLESAEAYAEMLCVAAARAQAALAALRNG